MQRYSQRVRNCMLGPIKGCQVCTCVHKTCLQRPAVLPLSYWCLAPLPYALPRDVYVISRGNVSLLAQEGPDFTVSRFVVRSRNYRLSQKSLSQVNRTNFARARYCDSKYANHSQIGLESSKTADSVNRERGTRTAFIAATLTLTSTEKSCCVPLSLLPAAANTRIH